MTKIIITEEQSRQLANQLKEEVYQMPQNIDKHENKPYTINPDKVKIVKNFLDKNFKKGNYDDIGPDGMPRRTRIVAMIAPTGDVLKNMWQEDLLDLLIDRFKNMFLDHTERELFLKQVMKDWFDNKIGVFGNLSVNRLLAENTTYEEVTAEANEADLNPTEKQKEAGNYKMGHVSVKGMKIAIENPKGSKRYYGEADENGNRKFNVMKNHYGYFNVTKGKDGDAVDCFLGPDIEDFDKVYAVDQNTKEGDFDETKVMLGFKSKEGAKEAYLSNYEPGWKGLRTITGVSLKTFKKWLYRGRKQRQPFADYVYIQKKKLDENKNGRH